MSLENYLNELPLEESKSTSSTPQAPEPELDDEIISGADLGGQTCSIIAWENLQTLTGGSQISNNFMNIVCTLRTTDFSAFMDNSGFQPPPPSQTAATSSRDRLLTGTPVDECVKHEETQFFENKTKIVYTDEKKISITRKGYELYSHKYLTLRKINFMHYGQAIAVLEWETLDNTTGNLLIHFKKIMIDHELSDVNINLINVDLIDGDNPHCDRKKEFSELTEAEKLKEQTLGCDPNHINKNDGTKDPTHCDKEAAFVVIPNIAMKNPAHFFKEDKPTDGSSRKCNGIGIYYRHESSPMINPGVIDVIYKCVEFVDFIGGKINLKIKTITDTAG